MNTGGLVAAMALSGLVGGVVGALLYAEVAAPPPAVAVRDDPSATPGRDPALDKEVAALRARLDEMQASVGTAVEESGRLRRDLEQERQSSAEARERLAGLESGGMRSLPPGMPVTPGEFSFKTGEGGVQVARLAAVEGATDRFRRAMELRAKPEEERWAAAREALGLTLAQEEDLKAAIRDRNQAISEATRIDTREIKSADGSTTQAITMAMPDPEKMAEATRRYNDRVASALNQEQAKKWREDGYEQAMGGGGVDFSSTRFVLPAEPVK